LFVFARLFAYLPRFLQ